MWQARAEHVWVTGANAGRDRAQPGLLLAWRRGVRGWEGWVVFVEAGIGAHGDGPYVRQMWLPGSAIKPLG